MFMVTTCDLTQSMQHQVFKVLKALFLYEILSGVVLGIGVAETESLPYTYMYMLHVIRFQNSHSVLIYMTSVEHSDARSCNLQRTRDST